VFVIDSKNWSGRITMNGGHLRQNGYSREKTAAGAADAALAVGERISAYAAWVHPVLCFVRQDHLSGCCREVMVCSSANLVEMLTTRPVVFTPQHIDYLHWKLDAELGRATSSPAPVRTIQRSVPSRRSFSMPARPRPRRGSKRKGLSFLRFLMGIAMLFALIAVGPQLAAGIGGALTEQFTKNLGTQACAPTPAVESTQSPAHAHSTKRHRGTKANADKESAKRSVSESPLDNPAAPCATP
jgi:hypothetical protein